MVRPMVSYIGVTQVAGVVAYLLIFWVFIKKLPSPSTPPQVIETLPSPSKTNILVAMAIDCTSIGNIRNITRSIQVPATSNVEIFWYFNIYNAKSDKCTNEGNTTNQTPQLPRVRIAQEEIIKSIFWLKFLKPQNVQVEFNTRFDFVWMVDSDLLLEALNFGAFLHIVQTLDFGIAQPAILGTCSTCRGSDHLHLNKRSVPDLSVIANDSIYEIRSLATITSTSRGRIPRGADWAKV